MGRVTWVKLAAGTDKQCAVAKAVTIFLVA